MDESPSLPRVSSCCNRRLSDEQLDIALSTDIHFQLHGIQSRPGPSMEGDIGLVLFVGKYNDQRW